MTRLELLKEMLLYDYKFAPCLCEVPDDLTSLARPWVSGSHRTWMCIHAHAVFDNNAYWFVLVDKQTAHVVGPTRIWLPVGFAVGQHAR